MPHKKVEKIQLFIYRSKVNLLFKFFDVCGVQRHSFENQLIYYF